jgi:hypothetical protein
VKIIKKDLDILFTRRHIQGVSKGAGETKTLPVWSKCGVSDMAMYIVTIWASIEIGDGMCYEFEEKLVVPEYELEYVQKYDVKSIQAID